MYHGDIACRKGDKCLLREPFRAAGQLKSSLWFEGALSGFGVPFSQVIILRTCNSDTGTGMDSERLSHPFRALDFLMIFKSNLCLMFIMVFSASSFLLCFPNLDAAFMAPSQNILGAFASVFVHRDFTHLVANVLLALAALLAYSMSNAISGIRGDNFVVFAVWISAVLANLGYVRTLPYLISYGSSGLVSALLSGVVIVAFSNAWAESVPRVKVAQAAIAVFFFAAFIALNLDVAPEMNVGIHLRSFVNMGVLMFGRRFLTSFFSKTD